MTIMKVYSSIARRLMAECTHPSVAAGRRARVGRHLVEARRSFVAEPTLPKLEMVSMNVPTMGDSITEGTIVEWTVKVGQKVHEEDVVALIETDKVTVEIKAICDGVVMQQFGAVDDTIEVGAALCEIDTEGVPTIEAEFSTSAKSTETAVPAPAPAPALTSTSTPPKPDFVKSLSTSPTTSDAASQRVPSIRFLGKEGWKMVLSGQDPFAPPVVKIPAAYGRLKFTEEEMEALVSGGASMV